MQHGTGVASLAVGNSLGVAPKARWKMADYGGSGTYSILSSVRRIYRPIAKLYFCDY